MTDQPRPAPDTIDGSPAADVIGRVLGTTGEEATPLDFWVAVAPDRSVQLDDVVALERKLPDGQTVAMFGLVTQLRARHEGARFSSDVFLIADGVLPAEVSEAAHVQATRFEPETFVPPLPGTAVRRATGDERDRALCYDQMERRLPAGASRAGEPIHLNLDFLDGTRGAHVNISGVSGVATKTSYATFLLYSLFQSGVLGAEAANTKALVFNVKGEDLLFLDHPNRRLADPQEGPGVSARYRALGLAAGPFRSVGFFAPPRPGDPNATPHTGARTTGVRPFFWTLAEFCRRRMLAFLFADADDERQQYTIVVANVAARLEELTDLGDGAVAVPAPGGGTTMCRTFRELVAAIEAKLLPEDPDDPHSRPDVRWTGQAVGAGTINAFLRRLHAAVEHVSPLVRADIADARQHAVDLEAHQVTVVDIHNLHDRAQRFVVGVVLREAFERKERSGRADPRQLVVLDELNKYAPRSGTSPIKELLLDIAERGRSLGIVLIGAQQTASEVERRIVANSAIRVVGRLDPAEAGRDEYGFLGPVGRQRATILKPGTMFVTQPELPVPLVCEFPFPAWATRSSEADVAAAGAAGSAAAGAPGSPGAPADPFAGLD